MPKPESNWLPTSKTFTMLAVAHDWNRLPSEMGICAPEDDIKLMTAYTLTRSDMEAVESFDAMSKRS